ncbi:MAG: glycoside hydrolase family 55 protein [Lachnospiraceae bacterium]|nr:glycoside hydrolase family 55 protein [Lachnospiraceae bacterium]
MTKNMEETKTAKNRREKRGGLLAALIPAALLFLGCVCGAVFFLPKGATKTMAGAGTEITDFHTDLLGENVYLFRETDDHEAIQRTVDELYDRLETDQFGRTRVALCFFPGDYSDVTVPVGFYTQVLGLGAYPTDVKLGALVCTATWLGDEYNHNATQNFWRSVENVEICSGTVWAVSQATDMRRVQIDGALHLHDDYGWASGGFLADSRILTMVDSGSQQQWLSRNNQYRTWVDDNWNIVLVGDEPGGLPVGTWPVKSYTVVDAAPAVQDKPLLLWTDPADPGDMGIMIPARREDATGISWSHGKHLDTSEAGWSPEEVKTYGRTLSEEVLTDLSLFPQELGRISGMDAWYVAKPEADDAASITAALAQGKNILFTPGVYDLAEPIRAEGSQVLLGLGLATLRAVAGNVCLETAGDDLMLAGLLFDAGPAAVSESGETQVSPNLLHVGAGKNVTLNDLYFRVGGTPTDRPARAERCITIDADGVIGENLWVWRADHGDQVAWDKNVTENGIVINGNDALMYALMVEHFHHYQTVWNGENGRLYMYQSEVPYDVPAGEDWTSRNGTRAGYASLYVDDAVTKWHGEGLGIYLYNRDATALLESAVELPDTPGVDAHHTITVLLTANPGMHHVINSSGAAVMRPGEEAILLDYCNKESR